jgi:hypothetical protein
MTAHSEQRAAAADLGDMSAFAGAADPEVCQGEVVAYWVLGADLPKRGRDLQCGFPAPVGPVGETDQLGDFQEMSVERENQLGGGDRPETQIHASGSRTGRSAHPAQEHAHSLACRAASGAAEQADEASALGASGRKIQSLGLDSSQAMERSHAGIEHGTDVCVIGLELCLE